MAVLTRRFSLPGPTGPNGEACSPGKRQISNFTSRSATGALGYSSWRYPNASSSLSTFSCLTNTVSR